MIEKPIKITDELLKEHFSVPARDDATVERKINIDTPKFNAAQETLERATRFAELAIEATLGRREDYPQAFARLRVVIAAAIEEDRESSAQIAKKVLDERIFGDTTKSRIGSIVADAIRTRAAR
jgi:hypothetical protein